MKPLTFSSGDLVADRRADYAGMLFAAGDCAAAVDLMRDAVALVPGWSAGRFRLGEMLEGAGDRAGAVEAWRTVLRLDPEDRFGAALKLELTGAAAGIGAPSSAFVETLFDQYAVDFDSALVERLDYRVPELLQTAIAATGRKSFAHVLDLGCGTGLMGERLRASASFLEGLDLSAEMLKQAERKRVYDRLSRADLQVLPALPEGADLVTAADVLMYIGALDRVFALAAAALPAGGLFAFSVERHDGAEGMILRASRRYAHSENCVRAGLDAAGLDILSVDHATIRTDRGAAIEGLIVVAERTTASAAATTRPDSEAMPALPAV